MAKPSSTAIAFKTLSSDAALKNSLESIASHLVFIGEQLEDHGISMERVRIVVQKPMEAAWKSIEILAKNYNLDKLSEIIQKAIEKEEEQSFDGRAIGVIGTHWDEDSTKLFEALYCAAKIANSQSSRGSEQSIETFKSYCEDNSRFEEFFLKNKTFHQVLNVLNADKPFSEVQPLSPTVVDNGSKYSPSSNSNYDSDDQDKNSEDSIDLNEINFESGKSGPQRR